LVLVGGWAVHCRLRMGRQAARMTVDLDVLIGGHLRPARQRLDAIHAVQSDPKHSCRLEGLGIDVDLLTGDDPPVLRGHETSRVVEDPDRLRLLKPPQGQLLARLVDPVRVADDTATADALLPRAAPLLAVKLANLTLAPARGTPSSDSLTWFVRDERSRSTGACLRSRPPCVVRRPARSKA
jgi:hypothetical protein